MTRLPRRDVALAAVAALLALAEALAGHVLGAGPEITVPAAAGAVAAGATLALRRAAPRLGWLLALAAFALLSLTTTAEVQAAYLAVLYGVFNAGRRDRGRWSWAAGVGLAALAALAEVLVGQDAYAYSFLAPFVWFAGRAVGDREVVAGRLAERAAELEAERDAYAGLSVRYERARIAADLHDIVAHALSVMVVQAGAGQRLAGVDAELTAETFAAISESARQAEQDMGRLVALLGDDEAIAPAPDLELVEELVRRAAGSGLDVRLRLEGEREGLPAEVVETAYRVVQESLTNALRYASGAAVQVLVRGEADALVVEVANSATRAHGGLAGAGTGNGLRGLHERVGACGGLLEAGPAAGGGWSVAARLPRLAAVAA